jgi:hypothetical protein
MKKYLTLVLAVLFLPFGAKGNELPVPNLIPALTSNGTGKQFEFSQVGLISEVTKGDLNYLFKRTGPTGFKIHRKDGDTVTELNLEFLNSEHLIGARLVDIRSDGDYLNVLFRTPRSYSYYVAKLVDGGWKLWLWIDIFQSEFLFGDSNDNSVVSVSISNSGSVVIKRENKEDAHYVLNIENGTVTGEGHSTNLATVRAIRASQ